MNYGTDYGFGTTNIDKETGIRFGVIPMNDVTQYWSDNSEPDYAPGESEEDDEDSDDEEDSGDDEEDDDEEDSFMDDSEPLGFYIDNEEYKAYQSQDDSDIFITRSPYYTYAQFCSPCAPGACYLRSPVDKNGPKCYCPDPDWFDAYDESEVTGVYCGQKTSCPFPVYRVSDDERVFQPKNNEENSDE